MASIHGKSLSKVPSAGSIHAMMELILGETLYGIACPSLLERTSWLEILKLEIYLWVENTKLAVENSEYLNQVYSFW